ncbi:MAG: zinc ribbon domain-containing protein [Vicinamibacterales bacterium]
MARRTTDTPRRPRQGAAAPPPAAPAATEAGIRPWHLLLMATVLAIAIGIVATRGTSTVNAVAVAVAIGSVAWVAATVARTVEPLVAPETGEQTEMVGGRTRAALEREKMLVLRSIKEVEFDRAMGKISVADFDEVSGRLRARAAGLLRQLDADRSGYRALIERELSTRVGRVAALAPPGPAGLVAPAAAAGTCPACGTANDADARFCKSCGARIEAAR